MPHEPDYTCPITSIEDGDSVDAATTNQPITDLASRTDYLKCLIESLDFTTGHFISDVTFDESVEVGDVVYYDTSQDPPKYNKAFVDVVGRDVYDHEDGSIRTLDSAVSDSSYAIGVVTSTGPENTICVGGTFRSANFGAGLIANLIGNSGTLDNTILGQYYLSNSSDTAGKVQKAKPPLGVPTCFIALDEAGDSGEYVVTVNPQLHDLLLAHRHYSFNLNAQPGTALPIGYSTTSPLTLSNTVGDTLEIYLSEWTGDPCNRSASSSYLHVGTGVFAGNDDDYGALLANFQPNDDFIGFLKEEEGCIGTTGGPDDIFDAAVMVWDRDGYIAETIDGSSIGSIDSGFMADLAYGAAERSPVYRIGTDDEKYIINTDLLLRDLDDGSDAWDDILIAGWCPCVNNPTDCPDGAVYYYDWANDGVLSEVWPPYPVASTVMFINGALTNTSKLSINTDGIFWFDDEDPPFSPRVPDVPAPINGDWDETNFGDILPHENILFYTIIASNTDEISVRSLTPAEGSVITLKNANGEDKVSGDLIINAEFALSDDSPATGAYVVKDIEGFAVQKGYVVEKIKSGPLITVQSSIAGGYGEVTISAADFGGIREDEPDLFFADDIIVERHKDIFYKVFPPSRQSSLTGKVFIPTFLPTDNGETYTIKIFGQFMTPSSGSGLALPDLNTEYKVVSNSMTTDYEGSTGNIDTDDNLQTGALVLGTGYDQYGYVVKAITNDITVTPGDTFMFKVIRDGASDASTYKVGLIDVRYQISKVD